jgi:hypothetical protein
VAALESSSLPIPGQHRLIERAQPHRTVQALIQIRFDLAVAQPPQILGLDFPAQVFPETLAGRDGLKLQAHITTTATLGLRHVDLHRTPSDGKVAWIMPVAIKISALVRAAPAAIQACFFRLCPAPTPIARAPQEAFHFGLQALFKTTSRQVKDQSLHVLTNSKTNSSEPLSGTCKGRLPMGTMVMT